THRGWSEPIGHQDHRRFAPQRRACLMWYFPHSIVASQSFTDLAVPEARSKKSVRQQQIVAELATSPIVRISRLAERFGVSTETARRDIEELSQRGIIDRTYGGAATRYIGFQPAVTERDRHAVTERGRIAKAAAALVKPGNVVMIDSGSTTTQFARALASAVTGSVTVLTNSLSVATALVDIASV